MYLNIIAYLAGIFDGEGYIIVTKRSSKGSHVLLAGVKMLDPEACKLLFDTFGGNLYANSV